jgi:hypothetical protein
LTKRGKKGSYKTATKRKSNRERELFMKKLESKPDQNTYISLISLNRLSLSFKGWLLKLGASFGVASSSKYSAKSSRC